MDGELGQEQSAADFLRESVDTGAQEFIQSSDEFADLDEIIGDITSFDLPELDDEVTNMDEGLEAPMEEEPDTGKAETLTPEQARMLTEKYNLALDEISRLKGIEPAQKQPPVDAATQAEQQKAARRAAYDKYKSTRDLSDDELTVMEERLSAYMEATGQSQVTEQMNYLMQVVESMYLDNEKVRLENTFDKDTVSRYYGSAMQLVAAGKVPTIEDGILLLDARERRRNPGASNAPRQATPPKGPTKTQQRQAAASRHAPQPQAGVPQGQPVATGKLGAKDYLKAVLRGRVG